MAKEDIVEAARKHPDRVREWARQQTSRTDLFGYNFAEDPTGVVSWDKAPVDYAKSHPLRGIQTPVSQADLLLLIERVVSSFKHFVEDQRGWSLLWNQDGSEKPEEAVQLVFLGMAQHYLRLFNVEIDREVDLGRGPVDFKASSGTAMRVLIEAKKAHNGKFWHGIQTQLPSYLKSDDCEHGWYVAIRYRNNKASQTRMNELPAIVSKVADGTGTNLRYSAVDGRPKESASNQAAYG